ncbi:YchJ family metal-binding protein [Pelagicoccus sp. SDUM812003]|uniref:YchJ family protein n=1 Tax=Pelagicoccus sp. SDUM812003 TaxID=3041267 RepID=UPI00280EE1E8|nr:YchJ family metal-binding protein [Pelagicoccus sp. SDUM812003]MDQ8202690.1 YchJ family metal-binding protein [Pelagicoccus sp. SDUM812003]
MSAPNPKQSQSCEYADKSCPCGTETPYASCCGPYHQGSASPETAEQLMRSRYSAFALRKVDYLFETTFPSSRGAHLRQELAEGIDDPVWTSLSVLSTSQGRKGDKQGKVEFVAHYLLDGKPCAMHERSRFKRYQGAWKYVDGEDL